MRLIESRDDLTSVELTNDELILVNNAINEILDGPAAIDEPEFHTRVGVTRAEAVQLLAQISAILDD